MSATMLDHIAEALGPRGLRLVRAVPRDARHLLLELESTAEGDWPPVSIAGQWFADPDQAVQVAAVTRECTYGPTPWVAALGRSGVMVQAHGADRRLRTLARLVARTDATLVAHRPERRAVLKVGTGYVKVVRPSALEDLMARTRAASGSGPSMQVPDLLGADRAAGTVAMTAAPGRTLHELLGDPAVSDERIGTIGHSIGRGVARLHATTPPAGARGHTACDELRTTARWLGLAETFGLTEAGAPRIKTTVRDLWSRLTDGDRLAYLHRDLHDKQLVVDQRWGIGLTVLDLDLAALGDPALDLANLLVHLELRVLQGRVLPARARVCATGIVEGYDPDSALLRRVPAYARSTRLRLGAVYAFRPGQVPAGALPPGVAQEPEHTVHPCLRAAAGPLDPSQQE